nr:hypothetical protein [Sphingomonas sp.]
MELAPEFRVAEPAPTVKADRVPWALAGISVMALFLALWITRSAYPLNPDTPSYLYFDQLRTVGYPAFLWTVKATTGRVGLAVPIQMTLLAASLLLLGLSFHLFVRKASWSIAFQLLLVANPKQWDVSTAVMSDGLATVCVALWCAQLLTLIRKSSFAGFMILGVTAAAGMMVRPPLAALFLGSAAALLLLDSMSDRWRALGVLALAGAGAWALTPAAYYLIRGSAETTSPFARGVLQHTLYCPQPLVARDADAALVEQTAQRLQRYIGSAPPDVRSALEHAYSAPVRLGLIMPVIGRRHGLDAAWKTDPIIARIARDRVAGNPLCYAGSVANAYFELIMHRTLHSAAQAQRVDNFIATHPPLIVRSQPLLSADQGALDKAAVELGVKKRNSDGGSLHWTGNSSPTLIFLAQLLYGTAATVGLMAWGEMARAGRASPDRRRLLISIAAMAIAFHALFGATAIVEFALMRYMVPAWPITCALLAVAAILVGRPALRPALFASGPGLGSDTAPLRPISEFASRS